MADRGDYVEYADQCIRQAQQTEAPEGRALLLMVARAWLRLADKVDRTEETASIVSRIDSEQAG